MNHLKEYRKRAGLSAHKVALQIGVQDVTIFQWENGSKNPSLPKRERLAEIYGCTIQDLFPEEAA